MTQALKLFGTEAPQPATERFRIGDISFTLEASGIRHLRVGDREILRGLSFLVRDRDWGTTEPQEEEAAREVSAQRLLLVLRSVYRHGAASLGVDLTIEARADGLVFSAAGTARGAFETNRSGFTVLHPAALSGCPAQVTHADGTETKGKFPDLIDPWQPFMDMAGIAHQADGMSVRCAFEGDTFEMEDQRQWGDASFKTYNRPLAKPWPYLMADGETLTQSVAVTWQADPAARPAANTGLKRQSARFPQMAVLVAADQVARLLGDPANLLTVRPQRLLCHLDDTLGDVPGQFEAFAKLAQVFPDFVYDLELVCGFEERPADVLAGMRAAMDRAGFAPASVLVCPGVDRQSTPPGSDWPACPPLEEIHEASAGAFADLTRGGGMVSFFPELNRKRPPVQMLDFVSHGLCPIVHAADDVSVMETLEAVPHITRSAEALIGTCDYRIGPCTIAMRQNPYGDRTLPNPDRGRVCMADDDPRHGAAFGAAYAVGLAAALAPSRAQVWTPVEACGPRGLDGPLVGALAALAACADEPVLRAEVAGGLAELLLGDTHVAANLTPEPLDDLQPYEWRRM